MSTPANNLPSFRQVFDLEGAADDRVVQAINFLADQGTNHEQAFAALPGIIASQTKTAATQAVTENITNISESSTTPVTPPANIIGSVNNQEDVTSYTTQQSDYGALIVLGDASPIALTLSISPVITLPWYALVANLGASLVTAMPDSATISYPNNTAAASMPIEPGDGAIIAFDGASFWAVLLPVIPQNTPLVTSQWLNSYDAATGAFGQSQPSFGDISGTATAAQVPPLSSLTGQITSSQLPSGGVSATIITAALTTGGAHGSMTFVDGQLVAQTPAT